MKVNYAETQDRSAYLSTDFGLELATKKFGFTEEQLAEKCGRYVRGVRKGKLKGCIQWCKVVKGGWVKTGRYDEDAQRARGFVAKLGVCFAFRLESGSGEIIAEQNVTWTHSRDGKTLDVWGSYRYLELKREAELQAKRDEEERATRPREIVVIVKKADGTFGGALFTATPAEISEWQAKIGQEVTVTCTISDATDTGILERIKEL